MEILLERHYFYTEIRGRKPILNPALGIHMGAGKRFMFRNLELMEENKVLMENPSTL